LACEQHSAGQWNLIKTLALQRIVLVQDSFAKFAFQKIKMFLNIFSAMQSFATR
jgi:hypothetical protein